VTNAIGLHSAISKDWTTLLINDRISVLIWDLTTAVCDTLLSFTMCYILYTSRTDYSRYGLCLALVLC
jgi:hypothetical protein